MTIFWLTLLTLMIGCLSLALFLVAALYFSLPRRKSFSFNKKHAVITGGSKGIGKQIALCLVARGCNVSIIARNERDLQNACKELQSAADKRGQQQQVRWYSLDLTTGFEEVQTIMARVEANLGPVDVLINNAGARDQGSFDEQSITGFEGQMRVNYLTAVYPTRYVVSGMKSRRSGHISFVSSVAGLCGVYGYSAYCSSKFALRGLADTLQMELLQHNISVSILYPPNTDSEGFRIQSIKRPEETRAISDTFGLFTPQEVAEAHVKNIENGYYATSLGRELWLLNIASAGASPERDVINAFIQVMLAGMCRFIMLIYLGRFNRAVKRIFEKRNAHREQQQRG